MSLTLEEMITLASTLNTHTSGAITAIIIAHIEFGISKSPQGYEDQPSMRTANMATPM